MLCVSDPGLPLRLARRHRSIAVGETVSLRAPGIDPTQLLDLVVGGGFALEALGWARSGPRAVVRRLRTLPDFVGPGMRVLVCGLNPSLHAADAGYGYAGPGNRFWPAALEAGLVSKPRDPFHAVEHDGVGMTDLCKRASPRAGEVGAAEFREGAARVERLVRWLGPTTVLFVGLAGYRAALDRHARPGWQPGGFAGVPAYVMPHTSGLNARTSFAELVAHLRAVVSASGGRRAPRCG